MSKEDAATFHRQVAEGLAARYQGSKQQPEGWRETMAWHWEQADALTEAVGAALEIVDARITRLDFYAARIWVERALTLIGRMPADEQLSYELRACTLALAVLEFGGQYREGLEFARRILRAAQSRASIEAEGRAELAIGRMQRELGQLAAAETTLLKARGLAERDELGELEADVRFHLAKVHQLQGRHLEALQELQLAREEQEQHDDQIKLARIFTGIGDIYRVLGSSHEALTFYIRALGLEQGVGNLLGQAILKDKLALTALDQGRLTEALASAEESLQLRERLRDVVGQARSYTVLGTIVARLGRDELALSYHEQARSLQEQTQNPRGQAIALLHLGDIARRMKRLDTAHMHYSQALSLARRDDDQIGIARALERLGDLSFEEGRRELANISWSEALRIRDTLHHSEEAAALRGRIQSGFVRRT